MEAGAIQKYHGLAQSRFVWVSVCALMCILPCATQAGQSSTIPADSRVLGQIPLAAHTQQNVLQALPPSVLPDPQPNAQQNTQSSAENKDAQLFGSINGKVIDQSGTPVGAALVTLAREGQTGSLEVQTDGDGQFSFADLSPGMFQLTITSPGLATQVLYETLDAGQVCNLPSIKLTVATQVTEVHVGVTSQEMAEDEVKEEEQQRLFKVIPNFYVTYEPHPAPLSTKLKFKLAWKSASDPFTLTAVGAVAGIEQANGQWRGYGQGASGYAKRYGASYADVFVGTYIGSAVLPSLLKQDPRYYYLGRGSVRARLFHALAGSVITHGDNGRLEPNFSNIGGALATGGLANLYYPGPQRNGARVVFSTALIRIGETAVANVFQEFLLSKSARNRPNR
ncbi:MAG TPA: carboxypeptidase-like regulatory domain-containing protein [Candidatus Acidoferrum sp.]|nr:carboxypeptidase-like regulatory domain-containing protein [Candidatus Acidoferrum sp.]